MRKIALGLALALLCATTFAQTPIGQISSSMVGQPVVIEGAVTQIVASTYERQPNRLTVTDDSGSVTVVIWPDAFDALAPAPTQGSQVRIDGQVGEYRGQLQVRVNDAAEVTVAGGAASEATPPADVETTSLSAVTAAMQGQTVTVEGAIDAIRSSSSPTIPNTLTVTGDSGTTTLAIWPEVFDLLSPIPGTGDRLRATGTVGTHRGNVQVACRDARLILLLDEAGESLSTPPAVASGDRPSDDDDDDTEDAPSGPAVEIAVSDIDGSTVGQNVILTGSVIQIRAAWSERAPNIITLSDGTSTIPVVAWSSTWESLERTPAQGDRVRITGSVSLYQQRNEIQVHLSTLEFVE